MTKAKLLPKLNSVPQRIRAPLDGEYLVKVQETIDNFFVETKEYLEQKYKEKAPHIELQFHPFALESCDSSNAIITNDKINYLLYNDRLVAGVIERRTEFNNLEYIFFRNLKGLEFKHPLIKRFRI
jgi:hypothetical protein